jgi:hypothetical protein
VSPTLDEQGIRIDLDAHLGELTRQLIDAAGVYTDLGLAPGGASAEEQHVRDLHQRNIDRVDTAWRWGLSRLDALHSYAARLSQIQRLDEAIERAAQLARLDSRVDELVAGTGADELGTNEIERSARGVHDMLRARQDAWALLRGDYLAISSLRSG